MLLKNMKIPVEILADINVSSYYWCHSAKLIHVNGTGAFEITTMEISNEYSTYLSHMKLKWSSDSTKGFTVMSYMCQSIGHWLWFK